jgi:hypothetical protein
VAEEMEELREITTNHNNNSGEAESGANWRNLLDRTALIPMLLLGQWSKSSGNFFVFYRKPSRNTMDQEIFKGLFGPHTVPKISASRTNSSTKINFFIHKIKQITKTTACCHGTGYPFLYKKKHHTHKKNSQYAKSCSL